MESNIILDKKIVSQLIDYWKHTDPCYQGEEGNSFFFTGGCLIFASALGRFLLENDKECEIIELLTGSHYVLKFDGAYFDADGMWEDPFDAIINMGISYDGIKEDYMDERYNNMWSIEQTKQYCLRDRNEIKLYTKEIFYDFYYKMINEKQEID